MNPSDPETSAIDDPNAGATTDATQARFGLYFAPPAGSLFWQAGSAFLGRCALSGRALPQPVPADVDASVFAQATADPRRYGLHATLKAPFRLAEGCSPDGLIDACMRFASAQKAFALPPLRVEHLSGFFALTLPRAVPELDALAAQCVTGFDRFRAPLMPGEMQRRLRTPLDPVELALLARWGYPHVLERYRFHVSLTGRVDRLPTTVVDALRGAADELAQRIASEPLRFDALCVFRQQRPDAGFHLLHRAAFDG